MDADPQLISPTFPLLQTDEVCNDLTICQSFLKGVRSEDGVESGDTDHIILDGDEKDPTVLISGCEAANRYNKDLMMGCGLVWSTQVLRN